MTIIEALTGNTGPRVATTTAEKPQTQTQTPSFEEPCVHYLDGNCNTIRIARNAVENPLITEETRAQAAQILGQRRQYAVGEAPSVRCLVGGDISQCSRALPRVIQLSKRTW